VTTTLAAVAATIDDVSRLIWERVSVEAGDDALLLLLALALAFYNYIP
jgi:hypothetical protein